MQIFNTDVLIIVNVQQDFCPGGSMAAPNGDKVVRPLNYFIKKFKKVGATIVYSFEQHPVKHCSFIKCGGVFPKHCVVDTKGAQPHSKLIIEPSAFVIYKGIQENIDTPSAFSGSYELEARIGLCKRVFIGGLTTEYCVKDTALDALSLLQTNVLTNCIASINKEDGEQALLDLRKSGVGIVYFF